MGQTVEKRQPLKNKSRAAMELGAGASGGKPVERLSGAGARLFTGGAVSNVPRPAPAEATFSASDARHCIDCFSTAKIIFREAAWLRDRAEGFGDFVRRAGQIGAGSQ